MPIPTNPPHDVDFSDAQTVEFRCPDGSADVYLALAGLTVAARHGLEMENALKYAEETYVDVNIFHEEHKTKVEKLKKLLRSCWESAKMLEIQKDFYMKYGVFPLSLIEGTAKMLRSYEDENLRENIQHDQGKIIKLVNRFFHCG